MESFARDKFLFYLVSCCLIALKYNFSQNGFSSRVFFRDMITSHSPKVNELILPAFGFSFENITQLREHFMTNQMLYNISSIKAINTISSCYTVLSLNYFVINFLSHKFASSQLFYCTHRFKNTIIFKKIRIKFTFN